MTYKTGIELEVVPTAGSSKSQILARIREAGINITDEGYTHRIMNSWKAVSDGSLSAGGFELVSPPMKGMKVIEEQIRKMCDALHGFATVDRRCGMHVHFDILGKHHFKRRVDTRTSSGKLRALKNKPAKDFTARLLRNYSYFQPVIDAVLAPSRRNNSYCAYIPDQTIMDLEQIDLWAKDKDNYAHLMYGMSGRYRVINLSCLESYGTVEFRQHQGTVNAEKIINWVRFCERIVTRSWDRKYVKYDDCNFYSMTVDGLMDFLGFGRTSPVRAYFKTRSMHFGFPAISTGIRLGQS